MEKLKRCYELAESLRIKEHEDMNDDSWYDCNLVRIKREDYCYEELEPTCTCDFSLMNPVIDAIQRNLIEFIVPKMLSKFIRNDDIEALITSYAFEAGLARTKDR